MKKYINKKGQVVEVLPGLGGIFICGIKNGMGKHRVKSPALPPRKTAEECYEDLQAYAKKNKWHVTA